jgi:hypothetical protein
VFENRVLGRIFGSKREEEAGGFTNIIRVIKSRRIRWGACSTHRRDEKWRKYFRWKT